MISFLLLGDFLQAQSPKSYKKYLNEPVPVLSLEEAMLHPDSVFSLNLSRQKLDLVPISIRNLKNLEVLNLKKNKLDSIPSWIGELQNLRVLVLNKNDIIYLPDEICLLKNLIVLQISENGLLEIPVGINNLSKLEFLDLWSNNLTSLPPTIEDLKNLTVLDMRMTPTKIDAQDAIREILPNTKIYFSAPCNICSD